MAFQEAGGSNYELPGGTVFDDPVPFMIDGFEFDKPDTAEDGTYLNDAAFVTTLEAPQTYNVVVHLIPGYKSITQATEPVALKTLHAVVYTFTSEDKETINSWNNIAPHAIQCELFDESPVLMYLQSKTPRKYRTGLQKFAIEWDLKFIESNDNN